MTMADRESVFTLENVTARLASFGYTVQDTDAFSLNFCMEKVRSTIKNEVNWKDIPEGLEHFAVDMACGEFLNAKLTFAPGDLSGLDLDAAVKQITDGDTTTVFAIGDGSETPEQRLNSFINYLLSYGKEQYSCFRRLRW